MQNSGRLDQSHQKWRAITSTESLFDEVCYGNYSFRCLHVARQLQGMDVAKLTQQAEASMIWMPGKEPCYKVHGGRNSRSEALAEVKNGGMAAVDEGLFSHPDLPGSQCCHAAIVDATCQSTLD